jgi:hypothetical protein
VDGKARLNPKAKGRIGNYVRPMPNNEAQKRHHAKSQETFLGRWGGKNTDDEFFKHDKSEMLSVASRDYVAPIPKPTIQK